MTDSLISYGPDYLEIYRQAAGFSEAEVERRGLRARRYVFHPDEIAEAEAQGF
jgi:hypothetical protein